MFNRYTDRQPEYSIWQYDGEEVLPHAVFDKLTRLGYKCQITSYQYNSTPMSASVERRVEILRAGEVFLVLHENEYLVFTDYHPNYYDDFSAPISKVYKLDRFEEVP
jgi:hypothetical protein